MSMDLDGALERRRLRRRLSVWRIGAVLLGLVAILALIARAGGEDGLGGSDQIARVAIEGLITDDRKQIELLEKLGESDRVKAVILAVNSPGGTTTGGESLYEAITALKAKKPVIAVCGTMATSAAYMISLATDRIVARGNTITGSVGVIFQFPEVSGLLDKLGVKMYEIKSGPLKANPSPFQPPDAAGLALAEEMVKESQQWFNALVADRRKISPSAVPGLTDGRIYSGRQALTLKLIDEIGGEKEALAWLAASKGIDAELKVVDWKPKSESGWDFFGSRDSFADRLAALAGLDLATRLDKNSVIQALQLDGLLSLWHGPEN
ncbi:MAG: signal peptide peptidase SppA [Hyphomicrobiaceae bacterium]